MVAAPRSRQAQLRVVAAVALASWWTYVAQPCIGALGTGCERWLEPAAADCVAGRLAARAAAPYLGLDETQQAAFASRHARYLLADRVDVWAMATRSGRDVHRWALLEGARPSEGAFLALTTHFGAGMWAHAAFAQRHNSVRFLFQPPSTTPNRWAHRLAQLRLGALERSMGHAPLPTGGSAQRIEQWWRDGGGVMALYDAPHAGRRRCIVLRSQLLGPLEVPAGLFVLATTHRVPVYFYRCLLDDATGQRRIQVRQPVVTADLQSLVHMAEQWLDESLRLDPAAWHFWPALEQLRQGTRGAYPAP